MKKILSIITLLFFTQVAYGGELYEITLPEALEYIKTHSPRLMIREMDVQAARNNISQANRLQNPSLTSASNIGKAGDGNPQQLVVSEVIEIGKRHHRKKLAESKYQLSIRALERTKFDLAMNVRDAYIDLVGAKTIHKVITEHQNIITELKQVAQNKLAKGNGTEMDVFQTMISYNQLEIEKNSAEVNVNNAITDLNRVIYRKDADYNSTNGIYAYDFKELMVPNPSIELPSLEELLKTHLDNCFDVKIAKQEINIAEKTLTTILRKRIPDLAVTGGWEYQEKYRSASGGFYSGGFAGVSLINIPLLYTFKPEINNAKIALEQANLRYDSEINETVKNISSAYSSFNTAKANLNQYNDNLIKDSIVLIDYAKTNFENGKSDLIALMVMEKCYKEISIGYTRALIEYCKTWNDLLRALNIESFEEPEAI